MVIILLSIILIAVAVIVILSQRKKTKDISHPVHCGDDVSYVTADEKSTQNIGVAGLSPSNGNVSEDEEWDIKNLARAISLLGHQVPELQLIKLLTEELIQRFHDTECDNRSFYDYILKECDSDSDSKYSTSFSVLKHFVMARRAGDTDKQIIEWVKQNYCYSNYSQRSIAHKTSQAGKPQSTTSTIAYTTVGEEFQNQIHSSLSRKHRALQYSNLIMQEFVKEYKTKSISNNDFLNYVSQRCKGLISAGTEDNITFSDIENLDKGIHSFSYSCTRKPISVRTSDITPLVVSESSEINALAEVANFLSTFRIPEQRIVFKDTQSKPKHKETAVTDVECLYNDFVSAEYSSLLTKNKKFEVTFRLFIMASEELSKGLSAAQVIDKLKNIHLIVDHSDKKKAIKSSESKNIKTVNGIRLSAIEYTILELIRRAQNELCIYVDKELAIERRFFTLVKMSRQHPHIEKIEFYRDASVNLYHINSADDIAYKLIIEITILLGRGLKPDEVFETLKPSLIDSSLGMKYMAMVEAPYSEESSQANNTFRGWDESVSIINSMSDDIRTEHLNKVNAFIDDKSINFDIDSIMDKLPMRFNSRGVICKKIKIEESEIPIFTDYDIEHPKHNYFVLIPQLLFTLKDVINIAYKASLR